MTALPAPEQSTGWLPLRCLMGDSGKGSLRLLAMLQCRDHTRLQPALGYLQVSVQAVHEVDQQALLLQLALADRALQGNTREAVVNGQLAITAGIGDAEVGLIGRQGFVEQAADSFHPVHSLRGGT